MAATANFLTFTITKLELFAGDIQLGSATGFFLKKAGDWFLVTNWHVLSGRDPSTGQARHDSGAVPDRCRFYTVGIAGENLTWTSHDFLLGDALLGSSNWLQHPVKGQGVDIGVLPLGAIDLGVGVKDLLDPTGYDPDMYLDMGAEVFLPGYPKGIAYAGYLPIWKRASIASSLEFGMGVSEQFFVDTATREGMSGAPCMAIANRAYYRRDKATGHVKWVENPISFRLLGVYSGRVNPSDGFEAQLGIVIRENLIFDILNDGVKSTVLL